MFPIFQVIGVDNWQKGNAEINAYVGLDESSAESIGNILELLEMPTSSPAKIEKLPSISKEGIYDPPAEKYYVLEDGQFAGVRDRSELP